MRVLTSREFRKKWIRRVAERGKVDYSKVFPKVERILRDVRNRGDSALVDYTRRFDEVSISRKDLKVSSDQVAESYRKIEGGYIKALKVASENIRCFHQTQLEKTTTIEPVKDVTIDQIVRPIPSVGVYAPGGGGAYPSSVLMCAIPAKVAGVRRVVVCSPPNRSGDLNPAVVVAADIAGVDEIYRVGGVQAIAAMAYGTETIARVDKIVGPGNIYVTAAKIIVSRELPIDFPAGPSEILIVADEKANPAYVASDLIAQAEHDPLGWAILLTPSRKLASATSVEVEKQLKTLPRSRVARSCLSRGGLIVVVKNMEEAVEYANMIAPEHLEIHAENMSRIVGSIENAGAVFMGEYTPVVLGDYSAGTNHVLPTGGYARAYSALSTGSFLKKIQVLRCSRRGCLSLRDTTVNLAELEGFDGHARSILLRR